jgi:hypothetical protein
MSELTKSGPPTKVLFLDIDGVLNSRRSVVACGGYPHSFEGKDRDRFDWIAVGLIRKLCEETDTSICLSSSWRVLHSVHDCANGLDLPIFDRTPSLHGNRGVEINAWLSGHPEVTTYAIVDDDSDMLPDQAPYFVRTDEKNGLSIQDFANLKRILKGLTDADEAIAFGVDEFSFTASRT